MAIRPILIHPDPRLRKPAARVEAVDEGVRALAEDMLATMYEAPGIGLAATQLGVMKQIFVMDCAGKDEPAEPMVLINPEIVWRSDEVVTSGRGACRSRTSTRR
jgi:peptide deformylase